jgi:uncharacterized protein YajQ (UPF0234 family)
MVSPFYVEQSAQWLYLDLTTYNYQDSIMPSFDVVSEVNHHELSNAVDQANREVSTRFDFKGTGSSFELDGSQITMNTESEFQLQQMYDMLCNKLVKRGIDISCLEMADPVIQLKTATQNVAVREGIETTDAKKMVKLIKENKLKVQAAIQGEQLRVTGKKRDDLQQVIALLKEGGFGLPLQFKNFRD